jgi:hypothetical protein
MDFIRFVEIPNTIICHHHHLPPPSSATTIICHHHHLPPPSSATTITLTDDYSHHHHFKHYHFSVVLLIPLSWLSRFNKALLTPPSPIASHVNVSSTIRITLQRLAKSLKHHPTNKTHNPYCPFNEKGRGSRRAAATARAGLSRARQYVIITITTGLSTMCFNGIHSNHKSKPFFQNFATIQLPLRRWPSSNRCWDTSTGECGRPSRRATRALVPSTPAPVFAPLNSHQ